ncbi:MAG: 2Fe-2S iron-sulfur cluster-binding protein [Candidatus Woesearchaeota archaeon]
MAKVTFEMDDIDYEASEGDKLVDVCREAGSSIPFGCTNGICGTCIVSVKQGSENLSEKDADEEMTLEMFGAEKPQHRLACQCTLKGDVTLDNP